MNRYTLAYRAGAKAGLSGNRSPCPLKGPIKRHYWHEGWRDGTKKTLLRWLKKRAAARHEAEEARLSEGKPHG